MSALLTLGSAAPGPATTPSATTPVCAPLSTCKSTEEITAWVWHYPKLWEGAQQCPGCARLMGGAVGSMIRAVWLSGRSGKCWEQGLGLRVPECIPAPTPHTIAHVRGCALPLPAVGQSPKLSLSRASAHPCSHFAGPVRYMQSLSTRTGPSDISLARSSLGLAALVLRVGTRQCLRCLCRHEEECVLSQLQ